MAVLRRGGQQTIRVSGLNLCMCVENFIKIHQQLTILDRLFLGVSLILGHRVVTCACNHIVIVFVYCQVHVYKMPSNVYCARKHLLQRLQASEAANNTWHLHHRTICIYRQLPQYQCSRHKQTRICRTPRTIWRSRTSERVSETEQLLLTNHSLLLLHLLSM